MKLQKRLSFTLIEMLIVIVIIGILAAALVPRLQSVQSRARDTKRKADMQQISTALNMYKMDNSAGILTTYTTQGGDWTPTLKTLLSPYVNSLPIDPTRNNSDRYYGIANMNWSPDPVCYLRDASRAYLETTKDPDYTNPANQCGFGNSHYFRVVP